MVGFQRPEYLRWLDERPDSMLPMGANTYRLMSGLPPATSSRTYRVGRCRLDMLLARLGAAGPQLCEPFRAFAGACPIGHRWQRATARPVGSTEP